jgi:hypothetical protein
MAHQSEPNGFVKELRELVAREIRPDYEWYSSHTTWPRITFRLSGVIVVVGSLLLPVITAAKDWPARDAVLTTVSLTVAILSSLSTFYRWDSTWQSRTKTAKDLRGVLAKWELALKAADQAPNPQESALLATQALFDEAFNIIGSETNSFFATVKWPEISGSNRDR